jgi:hypothetical protein
LAGLLAEQAETAESLLDRGHSQACSRQCKIKRMHRSMMSLSRRSILPGQLVLSIYSVRQSRFCGSGCSQPVWGISVDQNICKEEEVNTMRPYGRSPEQLLTALQSYDDELEELVQSLPRHELAVASPEGQELISAATRLKTSIKRDYASSQKYEREGKFSEVEQAFWAMFPHRLFVALQKLKLNTRPGPNWLAALYDAQHEVRHTMAGLREWIALRAKK